MFEVSFTSSRLEEVQPLASMLTASICHNGFLLLCLVNLFADIRFVIFIQDPPGYRSPTWFLRGSMNHFLSWIWRYLDFGKHSGVPWSKLLVRMFPPPSASLQTCLWLAMPAWAILLRVAPWTLVRKITATNKHVIRWFFRKMPRKLMWLRLFMAECPVPGCILNGSSFRLFRRGPPYKTIWKCPEWHPPAPKVWYPAL